MVIRRRSIMSYRLPFADVTLIRDQLINLLLAARDTVRSFPSVTEST